MKHNTSRQNLSSDKTRRQTLSQSSRNLPRVLRRPKAEAKYLVAQYLYDSNNHEAAENEVFDYIEKGTPHQYWLARSFVLLSDIYHAKGDDFQAVQYLQTLKESYTNSDDIQSMISQRLDAWNADNVVNAQ